MSESTPAVRTGTTMASVVGALGSAATSLLATFCCVGPVAYTVLGAGGVLAAARLQPWRPWLLAASAVFLASRPQVGLCIGPAAAHARGEGQQQHRRRRVALDPGVRAGARFAAFQPPQGPQRDARPAGVHDPAAGACGGGVQVHRRRRRGRRWIGTGRT